MPWSLLRAREERSGPHGGPEKIPWGRTLIASMAYSTWKMWPSGEKVLTPRSYSLLVRNISALLCD